jgi:hypothetical protein
MNHRDWPGWQLLLLTGLLAAPYLIEHAGIKGLGPEPADDVK